MLFACMGAGSGLVIGTSIRTFPFVSDLLRSFIIFFSGPSVPISPPMSIHAALLEVLFFYIRHSRSFIYSLFHTSKSTILTAKNSMSVRRWTDSVIPGDSCIVK